MSNNHFNYSPYFQQADPNASHNNQQALSQQRSTPPYYHVGNSTLPNESYARQPQYSTGAPSQHNLVSHTYQNNRRLDDGSELIGRGRTRIGRDPYAYASHSVELDTSGLGHLAYASTLESNTPAVDQNVPSRHLPSPTEQGGPAAYDSASSRSVAGYIPSRPNERSTAYDSRTHTHNSDYPHTASLAASAVAQVRRQMSTQSQSPTISSSSHPTKPFTNVERKPQAGPTSQQSQRDNNFNQHYHHTYHSPYPNPASLAQGKTRSPSLVVQEVEKRYQRHHNMAPGNAAVQSQPRPPHNTSSNYYETSNMSPMLPPSVQGNDERTQNIQHTRHTSVNNVADAPIVHSVEKGTTVNLISPPILENNFQTVDPNQVFNQQEYQRRKAAAEAQAQAAKKETQNTLQPALSAQSSKPNVEHKDKGKREGEIRALLGSMFGHMRDLKAKDPEMFLQVWEEFKKSQPPPRASSQAPVKDQRPISNTTSKVAETGSLLVSEDNRLPSPDTNETVTQHTFTSDPPHAQERLPDTIQPSFRIGKENPKGDREFPMEEQPLNGPAPRNSGKPSQSESYVQSLVNDLPTAVNTQPNSHMPSSANQASVSSTSNQSAPGAESLTKAMKAYYGDAGSKETHQSRPAALDRPLNLRSPTGEQPLNPDSQSKVSQRIPTQPITSGKTVPSEHGRPKLGRPRMETAVQGVSRNRPSNTSFGMLIPGTLEDAQPRNTGLKPQDSQPSQMKRSTAGLNEKTPKPLRWSDARQYTTGLSAANGNLEAQKSHPNRDPRYLMDRVNAGFTNTDHSDPNTQSRLAPNISSPPYAPLSKAEMARKRSFNEIVDLTLGESDDEDQEPAKRPRIPELTNGHSLPNEPARLASSTVPLSKSSISVGMPLDSRPGTFGGTERTLDELINSKEPLTAREQLRLAPIAQPLDPKKMKKMPFNPKTFARDLMISRGTHPTEKPLNWHLEILKDRFLYINDDTDLDTIRWDLLDPGGPEINQPSTEDDADTETEAEVEVPEFRVNSIPQQLQIGVNGGGDDDMDMTGLVHEPPVKPAKNIYPHSLQTRPTRGRPRGRPRGHPSRGLSHHSSPRVTSFTLPTHALADNPENQTSKSSFLVPYRNSSQADQSNVTAANENPVTTIDLSQFGAGVAPTTTPQNRNNYSLPTVNVQASGSGHASQSSGKRPAGRPPGAKSESKDKRSSQSSTPDSPKRRGRPPGSKNLSSSTSHILRSMPKRPTGLRTSEVPNDGIAIMVASRSQSRSQRSPSIAKSSEMSSGKVSGPERSRKPKSNKQPTSPKYQVYRCLWKECHAELHNLETLKRHIFKLHCKKEDNGKSECEWHECRRRQETMGGVALASPSEVHLSFPSEDLLKRHIEKGHLRQLAWELGDGPPTHPTDVDESDYLSDAQGRQITPRIQEPRENSHYIDSDLSPTKGKAIQVVIPRHNPALQYSTTIERLPEDMDIDPSESDKDSNEVVEYVGP